MISSASGSNHLNWVDSTAGADRPGEGEFPLGLKRQEKLGRLGRRDHIASSPFDDRVATAVEYAHLSDHDLPVVCFGTLCPSNRCS
jgi:hypothetical protein